MGFSVHLIWKAIDSDPEEIWTYLFKLSFYPYDLQDYDIPDGSLPEDLDTKYLQDYLEWLNKLEFLAKFAPEQYMKYNDTSNDLETVKKCIQEDIVSIQGAINKVKILDLKNIKSWLSVG